YQQSCGTKTHRRQCRLAWAS
ncbi:AMP-binding enzyme family protein, partial [Vibrio parahaemolyticus V-223/04]